jgi:hypothetical protein
MFFSKYSKYLIFLIFSDFTFSFNNNAFLITDYSEDNFNQSFFLLDYDHRSLIRNKDLTTFNSNFQSHLNLMLGQENALIFFGGKSQFNIDYRDSIQNATLNYDVNQSGFIWMTRFNPSLILAIGAFPLNNYLYFGQKLIWNRWSFFFDFQSHNQKTLVFDYWHEEFKNREKIIIYEDWKVKKAKTALNWNQGLHQFSIHSQYQKIDPVYNKDQVYFGVFDLQTRSLGLNWIWAHTFGLSILSSSHIGSHQGWRNEYSGVKRYHYSDLKRNYSEMTLFWQRGSWNLRLNAANERIAIRSPVNAIRQRKELLSWNRLFIPDLYVSLMSPFFKKAFLGDIYFDFQRYLIFVNREIDIKSMEMGIGGKGFYVTGAGKIRYSDSDFQSLVSIYFYNPELLFFNPNVYLKWSFDSRMYLKLNIQQVIPIFLSLGSFKSQEDSTENGLINNQTIWKLGEGLTISLNYSYQW